MQLYRTYRSCKKRKTKCLSEKLQRGIHRFVFTDRIHIDTNLLPFFVVADRRVSHAFRTRPRHLILACPSVAHRTNLAVSTHACFCFVYNFLIVHYFPSFLLALFIRACLKHAPTKRILFSCVFPAAVFSKIRSIRIKADIRNPFLQSAFRYFRAASLSLAQKSPLLHNAPA